MEKALLMQKDGLKYNFDFAFSSIPSKDIEYKDLINNPFALHRYDCNEFIYGKANFG
ncbi:hypothetical protein OLS43_08575 [Campylobacter jejuni]|nr:hypothetical protein [Campylobacter jejuni]